MSNANGRITDRILVPAWNNSLPSSDEIDSSLSNVLWFGIGVARSTWRRWWRRSSSACTQEINSYPTIGSVHPSILLSSNSAGGESGRSEVLLGSSGIGSLHCSTGSASNIYGATCDITQDPPHAETPSVTTHPPILVMGIQV